MKLEYNILWIDNDLKLYIENGDVKSIEDFLIDLGFEPKIIPVFDEGKLNDYLNISYDLIISDFNLNKENGDVIIYQLREEKKIDTEILFYSAKSNFLEDTEVKERLAFMERINIQIGRDSLLEKIEKVIELTVHKFLELNATRGLITAATSHLDVEIEDLVMLIIYEKLQLKDEDVDEIINHYVEDFLRKSPDHFIKKYNEVGFKNWFHRIEASRKWNIFRKLLKKIESIEINSFLNENKNYDKEVIEIRNQFAHAKTIVNEHGITTLKPQFGKDDFVFTKENCVKIRQDLIRHKRNIETLKKYLLNE